MDNNEGKDTSLWNCGVSSVDVSISSFFFFPDERVGFNVLPKGDVS